MINLWSLKLGYINLNNSLKMLAMKYGYRWNIHNMAYNRERVILRLPELISFPAVFDFPGAEIPGSYYIGASIFLERNQPSFPWDKLSGNRPLIYCALGSMLPYGDRTKCIDFFRTIIDSSNIRPNWQWVLTVGNNLKVEDLGLIPDNVLIVSHAPQLELLKRATMMITHGGANTVKECIYFGVPMIIITSMTTPLALSDIPVYTARVVYHGLGVEADLRKLTVTYLRNLIDTVDSDPYFRSQVKIMQAKFREIEEENLGVKLVEIILNSPITAQLEEGGE